MGFKTAELTRVETNCSVLSSALYPDFIRASVKELSCKESLYVCQSLFTAHVQRHSSSVSDDLVLDPVEHGGHFRVDAVFTRACALEAPADHPGEVPSPGPVVLTHERA